MSYNTNETQTSENALRYMKETRAYIERIKRVNRQTQHIELAVDDALLQMKAGQCLLARKVEQDYEIEHWEPYLREQWWAVSVTGRTLVIERPTNIDYQPGQLFSLLGPVGNPFRFRRSLRNILLLAYNTVPTPMMMMLPALFKNNVSVTLVLLGTARDYDTQHLAPEVEVVRADDHHVWEDQVMTLGWADQSFVLVGHGDELTQFSEVMGIVRERRNDIPKNFIFGIFQSMLPCGVGACHACTVKTEQGLNRSCVDGPAFDLTQVILP